MLDNAMQLVKGGVIQPTNLAIGTTIPNGGGALAATPTQFTYGSSTSLWGNTWTVADINSANFGAAFAAQRGGYATTQQAAVDAMPITINYTVPSTPTVISINLASTNPSSPATSVSWTVTFSTSVTGVAAGNFALVQSGGVSGASITSVTGSGTTRTVTANTGSGYGTLGLNMSNVTGISPAVTTAMPFVGQAYTISAPMTCITDSFSTTGTLDTSLWDVKTILGPFLPQVINAGGGDYRLRLTDTQNNEATFAQLKRTFPASGNKVVLEIDYFSYGGSGADGFAVTFSDATVASTTGGFGGSLGYAQNNTNPGFGGGWLGIGLDEYGNYPCNNESRTGYPAGWTDPVLGAGATVCGGSGGGNHYVAIRGSGSGTTGYNLLANTGIISATAPPSGAAGATPYRYRITLDHSDSVHAYVTVERDITGTGNSYTTLIPKFDVQASVAQAAVPANWLVSFTGSTGGATNNHEFKRVQICANAIAGGGPDHLEIDHTSGTGLTCTPSTLTIKACANAACTTAYTAGVTGTMSATGTPTVNWSGGSGFSIPAGSSTVTKDVQVTTPNIPVTFNAVSTPAASSATTCNFGGSTNCQFTAFDTGFLVSAPNHVAESTSTLTVKAVKKADNSLTCVPAFKSASKSVKLKCAYSNPATGTLPVRIGGAPLNATVSSTAACDGTGANLTLNFDATGTATPTLQYADVGQMNVSASYTGTAGSQDAGLSMIGTGSFVAAPKFFAFSGIPAGPIKAGNPFSATVSALNNAGAVTPNFGKESTPGPEGVTLTSNLVTPDPVTFPTASNPNPGNNIIPGSEFGAGGMVNDANGVATVNNLSWGEVGSIALQADVTSKNYLGSGLNATGTSAAIPFIPDHFDTVVVATSSTPMPCSTGSCPTLYNGFVYSGQPFTMQVTAKNLAGGTTTNYFSSYGLSHNVNLTVWDALGSVVTQNPPGGANAGVLGSGTLASTAFNDSLNRGVGTTNTQAYTFATSPTAPTNIYLRAVDAVNTSVTSRRATPATSVEGGVQVVSGKVKISNANGSELLPLPLTATAQYWNGASWVTSTNDSITQFNTNLDTSGGSIVATILNGLGSGVSVVTPGWVTVSGGVKTFTLNKPGIVGSADISLNAPAYLLGGSNGAGVNPSKPGRATFGVYKGSSQFIYLRENY
jgi:MSHA biogenesis protein MshQ